MHAFDSFDDEPSAADLAAIELETPLIDAGVLLVDAEIRMLTGVPTDIDWRRLRRAEARVMREATAYLLHLTTHPATCKDVA
jgi:hypothetical protein